MFGKQRIDYSVTLTDSVYEDLIYMLGSIERLIDRMDEEDRESSTFYDLWELMSEYKYALLEMIFKLERIDKISEYDVYLE